MLITSEHSEQWDDSAPDRVEVVELVETILVDKLPDGDDDVDAVRYQVPAFCILSFHFNAFYSNTSDNYQKCVFITVIMYHWRLLYDCDI